MPQYEMNFKNSYCEIVGAAKKFIAQWQRSDPVWAVLAVLTLITSNNNFDIHSRIKL